MSLTGHRKERVLIERLSKSGASLGFIDGEVGGQLNWNANADLPAGGYITLEDVGQELNYSRDRIRPWWEVDGYGSWPLGAYVIASPSDAYRGDGKNTTIDLIDILTTVRDDVLLETLHLPEGTNVVQAAVQQVQLAGEQRVAVTESDTVLTTAMTWYPGTSRYRVVNDLLTIAQYKGLYTDSQGQFRIEPYLAPGDRPSSYDFLEGEASVHSPQWEYSLNLWEATNTVVMVSQADEDDNTFSAYAVDDNPDSPTSTVSMDRVLNPIVEENVEAESQIVLQQMANRKLLDNSNVTGTLSVAHRPLPLWYGDAVTFKSQGMDTKATITKMTLNLKAGSLVNATWRQVR